MNYRKLYYSKNQERIRTRDNASRKIREATPSGLEKKKAQDIKWIHSGKGRYSNLKACAKKRNLEMSLTYESFLDITSKDCYYCGGKANGKSHVGIDRVDSKLGYTQSNVVPCCMICNKMKLTLTVREFLAHIELILARKSVIWV